MKDLTNTYPRISLCRVYGVLIQALKVLALLAMLPALTACSGLPSKAQEQLKPAPQAQDDVFVLSQNAQIAYTESRLIEAVQLYQKVIERVPADANAWFRLGNVYAQQGAYERAIHAYETSLVNDAQQPKAWFNLSTAHLLNAQLAMRQSYLHMRANDPARALIDGRLIQIDELLHGRIEESAASGFRTAQ